MTLKLDSVDCKLLAHLQRDGKASVQDLASAAGLSPSPCWRRVKRLEEAGAIRGYGARLDPEKLGLHALAYAFVSLTDHREETVQAFHRLIAEEKRVVDCASVTGASGFLLTLVARTPEELERLLSETLSASGLLRVDQVHFVLRRTKTRSPWPMLVDLS